MKVFLYTKDFGKLELVARGAKKIKSKIAGHIEPFNNIRIMAVRGKQYDYLGSAINKNSFINIKNNLEKIALASKSVKLFNELIKLELNDEELFIFLKDFLNILNQKEVNNYELIYCSFVLRLLQILGYKPDLNICSICKKNIGDFKYFFYNFKGEMVCENCNKDSKNISLNKDSLKILKYLLSNNFENILKLKLNQKNNKEVDLFICSFLQFNI